MSQAYESLGNREIIRNLGNKAAGSQMYVGGRTEFDVSTSFSAARWRQGYIRKLAVSDFAVLATVCGVGIFALPSPAPEQRFFLVASMVVWAVFLVLARTRATQQIGVGAREYKRVIESTAFAAGTMAVVTLVFNIEGVREAILIGFPTGMGLLLAERWIWRRWLWRKSAAGYALSQVVVVGQEHDIDYVVRQLRKKAGPAYKIAGLLLDGPMDNTLGVDAVPTFSGLENLETAVHAVEADSVIVAGPLRGGGNALKDLSWRLEESRTNVIVVSSLTNVAGPRISMRPVEGLPLMHVDMPSFSGGHHVIKRLIDTILAGAALIALAPVFLAIAIAIKATSEGPVFFSQDRVGLRGRTFRMYKFRSMVVNAEAELEKLQALNEGSGPLFKMKVDPRVTRIGAWLRKYSLDELPQIYNVLRGDMSLVGPRPPLPSEVECYEGYTERRLFIKPGLTGLWQISGRSDLDWEESVRLDLYYVENWSLTGDIMIIWRTFKVMLRPSGAY
ncbi:sugar transferase [Glutamicibacter creatinolyticus]|uniref:sugar transferase n=1 Tax=Glutamicibacter creatinolyticus TaxID=162496 RepID=UPI0031D7EED1